MVYNGFFLEYISYVLCILQSLFNRTAAAMAQSVRAFAQQAEQLGVRIPVATDLRRKNRK